MVMMTGSRKPPSYCLFLGDLSLFCKEEDLDREFSKYGEITALRIKRSKETHKNLCYGFVEYASPSAAVQAMNELDGKVMFGRPLRVRWASSVTSKSSRFTQKQKTEDSKPVSIYVAFTCFQLDRLVNEESLRDIFGRFGSVVDVAIKQSQTDTLANRQKGYAFISFTDDDSGVEAALGAARDMIDTTIDNINFRVEVSRVLEYRLQSSSHSPPDANNSSRGYLVPMQAPPMALPAPLMYNYDNVHNVPNQQYFPSQPPPPPQQMQYNPQQTSYSNMNIPPPLAHPNTHIVHQMHHPQMDNNNMYPMNNQIISPYNTNHLEPPQMMNIPYSNNYNNPPNNGTQTMNNQPQSTYFPVVQNTNINPYPTNQHYAPPAYNPNQRMY